MKFVFKASVLALSMFCLIFSKTDAHAQAVSMLASYGDWGVYSFKESNTRVCYVMTNPTEIRGEYNRQGKTHFLVTHRPGEKSFNVISYIPGYKFKATTPVWIEIEKERFHLASKRDKAWAPESDLDHKIVGKMKQAFTMYVVGTSLNGGRTLDKFSLEGFNKALKKANKMCGKK